ncbi:uncharacterized protein [Physcomitrium patens]|uniref:uncharacterized protein isoform X2 n=1 Tax=Physcomitrium patens TaxID=3218 RepID=UPI000D171EA7|nr:uncharacterized protein LOC112282450 isoform X2 [Physcomitrium patens]|eukprot:XP_024375806.1 uncharacterized protein LOC112282450 isoform X2 [Physcomitrella patens]
MIARIRVLLTSVHVEEHKWSVLRELAMASPRWEICSTWSIADGPEASHLSRHVTIRDVHSSDDGAGGMGNVRIRLVPGPEKQSCEITARTCEAYRQNEGETDAEYLCTARGQLETNEEKPYLYRAGMNVEDPGFCKSVTIRLLSLQDKSQVIVQHILIVASPGPFLAGGSRQVSVPEQAAIGGGNPAPSLGSLTPFMLQMAKGFSMPDMMNKMASSGDPGVQGFAHMFQSQQRGTLPHAELAMRALALKTEPHSSPPNSLPPVKTEVSLEDVCQRLERLETVCTRIESSLCKTLESFEKRLQLLENGLDRSSGT